MFFGDVASRPTLAGAAKRGDIRRLISGVWTADMVSPEAEIVAENLWLIVSRVLPDAILVDRTAARNGRLDRGVVTVATDTRKDPLALPGGITVLVRARDAADDDMPWVHGLAISSPARTLADNTAASRARGTAVARTLNNEELLDWVADKALAWDPERVERLRVDSLRHLNHRGLGDADPRVARILRLFDQLSGREPLGGRRNTSAAAVVAGEAWDKRRISMFDSVRVKLSELESVAFPIPKVAAELPFFEAYFSNCIEGTEFTVEDARVIVDTQRPPAMRSADGHDILGTYRCVVDPVGRARTSADPTEVIELMCQRHATMLAGRPDIGPGQFKLTDNRAGSTTFVPAAQVQGTLIRAFAGLDELPPGFARAVYAMFVVAEVHPFTDGNGRAARLMMNAELEAAGCCRIVVPTIIRNEYISSLRRASNNEGDVAALVRVMSHAWRWTAAMNWQGRENVDGLLRATNALIDSNEAAERHLQLELP